MAMASWDPTQFLRDDKNDEQTTPFALLVLNQPINETALMLLRKRALVTVCADGGANRFYDWMKSCGREDIDLPDIIIGDLDSIHPRIRSHYETRGVKIIHDPDQYSTDFTKCLKYLEANATEIISSSPPQLSDLDLPDLGTANEVSTTQIQTQTQTQSRTQTQNSNKHANATTQPNLDVLIMGGLGGRVDQAFSQIHHLYTMNQEFAVSSSTPSSTPTPETGKTEKEKDKRRTLGHLYLISEESITFILSKGRNIISTPRTRRPASGTGIQQNDDDESYLLEENVGIIPLSGPARISTRGFEWDVQDWLTEIGGQLSTSNHIRADVVEVEADGVVLFTVELARRLKRVVGSRSS